MFVATSSLIFIQSIYFSLAIIVLVLGNFLILINLFAPTMAMSAQAISKTQLIFSNVSGNFICWFSKVKYILAGAQY
jgi:hypothetical protein